MKKSAMSRRQVGIYLTGAVAAAVAEAAARPVVAGPDTPPPPAPADNPGTGTPLTATDPLVEGILSRLGALEGSRGQFETAYDEKLTQTGNDFQTKLDTVHNQLNHTITVLKDQLRNTPPIGTIIMLAYDAAPPPGHLLCDGTTYTMADRPDLDMLRQAIGSTWGGDGTTNFNVPELRGEFPRFLSKGRNDINGNAVDVGRTLGESQPCMTAAPHATPFKATEAGGHTPTLVGTDGGHTHPMDIGIGWGDGGGIYGDAVGKANDHNPHNLWGFKIPDNTGKHSHTLNYVPDHPHPISGGDAETRPRNQALVGYIKF